MTSTSSRRFITALTVALTLAVAGATALSASQILGRRAPQNQNQTMTAEQAGKIAARLYVALLGREADPAGLRTATSEIQRGRLSNQVSTMIGSAEFRRGTQQLNADEVLARFYQGLLNRTPDTAGLNAYLPRLGRREYASVILEMLESPEFRATIGDTTGGGAAAVPNRLDAALDCQARVLEAVAKTAPGRRTFLSFDRMPETSQDGRVASGPAVDRFDNDRAMTYRCDGTNVSFFYGDRQNARGADPREPFASVAVNNCLTAASDALGGAPVVAASLSASDTRAEYVLALGMSGNRSVTAVCELDGMRVVSARRR